MPVFVLGFGMAFGFFMFVLPSKSGFVTKLMLSIGLSAASILIFTIFAPEWAMSKLGGD